MKQVVIKTILEKYQESPLYRCVMVLSKLEFSLRRTLRKYHSKYKMTSVSNIYAHKIIIETDGQTKVFVSYTINNSRKFIWVVIPNLTASADAYVEKRHA
jgi:hypothetical protein